MCGNVASVTRVPVFTCPPGFDGGEKKLLFFAGSDVLYSTIPGISSPKGKMAI